ncbi:GNAT family N-acetyltransferase [Leptothoe sp. PORK10 BA2]|uniref:GNAT family N-acetyltransferase n=1 Tax=Leptothoe sp. PORK10 BA2 TaxID=3110254 RepID=UPI002B1EF513|nr:GNAT family N-acetyltransferase [Leptothoe sp. PORK10 BA2]MEA5466615.1 GNAT family N-acetyltransferase [Leptothoe sp. PORK10 BA2]
MASHPYHIRAMTRDELDVALSWATAEGWNPGLHDGDCFHRTDPDGFLMGFLNGEPIASISAVKYGESFGFIGCYIVKPGFRGQGYGLTLWHGALDYLKGRNIGLDGVVAQQDNYVKSGFSLAHRNIRYAGVGRGIPHNSDCVPLAHLPTEKVIAYDRRFFPEERSGFIQCWMAQPGSHAVGVIQGQELVGYGVLRPCQRGYKIGPLFANGAAIADEIFQTLVAQVPQGDSFYLDVPQVNGAAVALAERYGMADDFETARMYTQSKPELPLNQIFGITTFELG